MNSISKLNIRKYCNESFVEVIDSIAAEEPLEISIEWIVNGMITCNTISITMRTPGNDQELALGFLYTEGILTSINQVKNTLMIDNNRICIILNEDLHIDIERFNRHFYTTSSCGVCGKTSIDAIRTIASSNVLIDSFKISTSVLYRLNEEVKKAQKVFESTGGLHAAALFDMDGKMLELQEDVGRHNALDKLIGLNFLRNSLPLHNYILFLSGRASFELIQKAITAKIPIVCALGAPSSLAIGLAEEFNITLLGFLKDNSFNLYSGYHRICE